MKQKSEIQLFNREKMMTICGRNFEIKEQCKGVHCVDLGESFPTSIYFQKSASIQPAASVEALGTRERAPRSLGENIQYYSLVSLLRTRFQP